LNAGQPDLAIEHLEASLRLDPRTPIRPFHMAWLGMAHFLARRFDEAISALRASLQQRPSYVTTYRYLAACYALMGRLDEAREIVERLRAITPAVMPVFSRRGSELDELLVSGLRLAAGETT
jgi:adenylate cyclase